LEPSKKNAKAPLVVAPNCVGMNLTRSESSTRPSVGNWIGRSKLIKILPSDNSAKASRSAFATPTSDPSK